MYTTQTAYSDKTVAVTMKSKTKTLTPIRPMAKLLNLVESLAGAAREIDKEACPFPTPTVQDTETLESLTATIIAMMGKYDARRKGTRVHRGQGKQLLRGRRRPYLPRGWAAPSAGNAERAWRTTLQWFSCGSSKEGPILHKITSSMNR
jgi:hypothetical protein